MKILVINKYQAFIKYWNILNKNGMQVLLAKNNNLTSRHNPSENINITRGSPGYLCKLSEEASFEIFEKKHLLLIFP